MSASASSVSPLEAHLQQDAVPQEHDQVKALKKRVKGAKREDDRYDGHEHDGERHRDVLYRKKGEEHRVVAATIDKLVEAVVDPHFNTSSKDIAALVTGSVFFFNSHDLLAMLMRAFVKAKENVRGEKAEANLTRRRRLLEILRFWLKLVPGDFKEESTAVGFGLLRASFESSNDAFEREWLQKLKDAEADARSRSEIVPISESVQRIVAAGCGNAEAASESESRLQSRLITHGKKKSSKRFASQGLSIRSKFSVFVGRMALNDSTNPHGQLASGHLLTSRVAPAVLACQMTLYDYFLIERISMREILRGSWKVSPDQAILDVRDHFQRVVLWIASEILSDVDKIERAAKLSRVLFLAEALLELNNMHGAFAVHRALRLPCIDRLKTTWKHLHSDAQKVHARLESLFNFDWDGGEAYRSHTEKCLKQKRTAMVPALWIMLEDVDEALAKRSLFHRDSNLISFFTLGYFLNIADTRRKLLRRRYAIGVDEQIQFVLREGLVITPMIELDRLSLSVQPDRMNGKSSKKSKDEGYRAARWFYGNISRAQAEQVLMMTKQDSFLVRCGLGKSHSDSFIVSSRFYQRNVIIHRLIEPAYEDAKRLTVKCTLSDTDEENLIGGQRALVNSTREEISVYGLGRTFVDLVDLVANDAELYGLKVAVNELGRTLKSEQRLPISEYDRSNDGKDVRQNVKLSGFDGVLLQRDHPLHLFIWEGIFVSAEEELTQDDLGAALRSDGLRGNPTRRSLSAATSQAVATAEALISEGSVDQLIELIRTNVLPAATVFPNLQHQTLLHVAAEFNEPHLIDILMFDPDPPLIDARDASFSTALHVACRGGFLAVARNLLAKGASAAALTATGASPLHYSMRRRHSGDPGIINDLVAALIRKGAAVNGPDLDHNTPLFHAVMTGNPEGVAALLEHGADPDNRNLRGMSALGLLSQYEKDVGSRAQIWLEIRRLLEEASDGKPSPPPPIAGATRRFLLTSGNGSDDIHCELKRFNDAIAAGLASFAHSRSIDPNSRNFIAQDPERGTVWLSISQRDGREVGLVRSKHADAEFDLGTEMDPKVIVRALKVTAGLQFTAFEASAELEGEATPLQKALSEADVALQDGVMDFALLYARSDAFRPSELMHASADEYTVNMKAFLKFLGEPADGAKSSRAIAARHGGAKMNFWPVASLSTEERPRTLSKHGVLIVFSDAPQVDTTIFGKLPAPIIILVRPEPNGSDTLSPHIAVNVLTDHGVRQFVGPRLPSPPLLSLDSGEQSRSFFLALVSSCWHEASRGAIPFKSKRERTRERELSKLNTALQMMSTRMTSLARLEEADDKPEAKQGRPSDYLLGKELGSGATGKTYTALHKVTRQKFCMKVVNLQVLKDSPNIIKQVRLEVEILSKVRHDNIVKLYESYETPEALFLVIQLCTGGDLERYVRDNGPFSERRAKALARQLLSAVAIMRRNKVSHRDIKPENLMFMDTERETLILADFGLGKDTSTHAMNMTLAGTPDYIAPEILEAKGYDYFKVDDYSSGCVVYFMLFGKPPYAMYEPGEMLFTAIMAGAANFKHPSVKVSDEGKDFIRALMNADPAKRLTAASALGHPWLN